MDRDVESRGTTVGRLARRFGLSRSTLLYYHRIGLLVPSRGGDGEYRYYSPADTRRLAKIMRYREAGVPLADIGVIIEGPEDKLATVLERRLEELNTEIARLREQQRVIAGLLKTEAAHQRIAVMNRTRWTELLEAAGFSDEDMRRWHADFERSDSDAHREFLQFLCIPDSEIEEIQRLGQ